MSTGAPGVPADFRPSRIVEVDLSDALPTLPAAAAGEPTDALVVVRLCGRPVGMLLVDGPAPVPPAALAARVDAGLGHLVRAAAAEHGLDPAAELPADGLPHADCPVRREQEKAARSGPGVSVVLCTRNRAASLTRCLDSFRQLRYAAYELIVVDNASPDGTTEEVCRSFAGELPVTYVVEPRPGLSRARNTGLRHARHEIVAFVDDDERVDPLWLVGIVAELADPAVGAVSGLVLPAELGTGSQARFEQFGGHSKGRGFARAAFTRSGGQSPLYPLPAFGVGANMAFRAAALRGAGGFDEALGAGTATSGAEDTAVFTEVLLRKWDMVYAPAAVTWHYHRDDDAELRRQLVGYGVGLGAYYAALVLRDPRRLAPLLRLLPTAYRDFTRPDSLRGATLSALPGDAARGNALGILRGPFVYARVRAEQALGAA